MCYNVTVSEFFPENSYTLFKYVPRCIVVSDNDFPAVRANPHSVRQLQIVVLMPAVVAYLGRCEPSSSLDTLLFVESTLVVNFTIDFTDASILQCTRNLVIAHHSGYVGVFSEDNIVSHNEISCHLLSVVLPDVSHMLAMLCELKTCFIVIFSCVRRVLRNFIRLHIFIFF